MTLHPRRQNSSRPQLWEHHRLHDVTSQKTELFKTTAVRTSGPTWRYIPEDRTLQDHSCENITAYKAEHCLLASGLCNNAASKSDYKTSNIWMITNGLASDNTLQSYSRGSWFQYRMGHRLNSLRSFVVFLSHSRQIPVQWLDLIHALFLQIYFHFIIHVSSFHPTLYT
jgi:hypothetical protein